MSLKKPRLTSKQAEVAVGHHLEAISYTLDQRLGILRLQTETTLPQRQRQRQAERIRAWSPWAHSTGTRSAEGKAASSRNGWKGGHLEMLRELARLLEAQFEGLEDF